MKNHLLVISVFIELRFGFAIKLTLEEYKLRYLDELQYYNKIRRLSIKSLGDEVEFSERSQCVDEALRKSEDLYDHYKSVFTECGDVSVNIDDLAECMTNNNIILSNYVPVIHSIEVEAENCIKLNDDQNLLHPGRF